VVNQKYVEATLYQVLPFRPMLLGAAWLTFITLLVVEWTGQLTGLSLPGRYAILLVNFLLILASFKVVWRPLWRVAKPLRDWFPDLNGNYDVELRHNWPIQQKLLEASANGTPFDPRLPDTEMPELGTAKLKAKIDIGFYAIRMTMWSERLEDGKAIIDHSRTISTTLIRPYDGHPHRLAYTYQQSNRRELIAPSDDTTFEGSAVLRIEDVESGELEGEYWTNRAWHRGLSTAGTIKLRRTSSK
jgi:hypothetical protein